jgi:hypothetical protein
VNDGSGLNDVDEIAILPTTEFASETLRVQKALESSQKQLIYVSEAESLFHQRLPRWYTEDSIEAANGRMLVHNSSLGTNRIVGNILVPEFGEYEIAARIRVADGGEMMIGVDGNARVSVSSSGLDTGWTWFSFGSFDLVAGEHMIFVDAAFDARLDEIILFSNRDSLTNIDQLFSGGGVEFSVTGEQVNSYAYEATTRASAPFLLVLSESYHPLWRAYVDGQSISPMPAYSFVNAFFMPEGNHEVSIMFTGQDYVTIGGLISSATIVCLAALLILNRKLRKREK